MAVTIDPLGAYRTAVEAANEVGNKIIAAKSDKSESVKAILSTSDDEKIVKYREGRAKIEEEIETLRARLVNAEGKITEYAETLVPGVDANFNVEEATADFIKKRAAAYAARKALLNFVSEEDLAAAEKELGIVPVVALRGKGGGTKGGGTGVKRPRISAATYNGEKVTKKGDETKVDFTSLGKASGESADVLKAAAFKAAETEDLNSLPAGHVVNFSVGDKRFSVTISGEKPGRKAAEKSE